MTKEEINKALLEGKRVKHMWFSPDEWMEYNEFREIVFEDGCKCSRFEFWQHRDDESWLTGWSIIEK